MEVSQFGLERGMVILHLRVVLRRPVDSRDIKLIKGQTADTMLLSLESSA